MSANANQAPVLVVGGGIGGLSTALALSRKGIPVQVLEQAPEFKEIGAGIQLGPERVPHVRGARADRADVPLVRVSRTRPGDRNSITAETIVDMRIDKRFHEQISRALRRHSSRRHAQCASCDACKKSNLIKLATSQKVVAIDDDRLGRHGEDRDRRDL